MKALSRWDRSAAGRHAVIAKPARCWQQLSQQDSGRRSRRLRVRANSLPAGNFASGRTGAAVASRFSRFIAKVCAAPTRDSRASEQGIFIGGQGIDRRGQGSEQENL
jgi:hypothetical protein